MAYYAIQKGLVETHSKALLTAPPVVHVFTSAKARDEWVARGSANGRGHRLAVTREEAYEQSCARSGSMVRHASMGARGRKKEAGHA